MRPAPAPLAAFVDRARRRWWGMRAAECALLGLCAALGTIGAAALSGVRPTDAAALAPAALSAAACAATWWYERRRDGRALALRLDGAADWPGGAGAFVTAWECEGATQRRANGVGLRALLSARLRAALSADGESALRRAVPPPSAAFAALPLLAAALCAWAIERAPSAGPVRGGPELARLQEALANGIAGLADSAAENPGATSDGVEADSDLQRLARWARRLEGASGAPPEELDRALSELEAELARRAGLTGAGEGIDSPWDGLRERAREARAAGSKTVDRAADRAGAEPQARSAGEDGANASSALAKGRAERTMGGSDPALDGGPGAPASGGGPAALGGPGPEAGTAAGRWWPERYDGIVAGWLERRRAETDDPGAGSGQEERDR